MKKDKTFRPDRVLSYFKAEWLPLVFVTLSGLVYNIGLLATPWFEGRLAQCLADILGGSETAAKMAMLVLAYILIIFKLIRYSRSFQLIGTVLKTVKEELITAYTACGIMLGFSGILMYYIERGAQPEAFANIGDGFWWAIVAFTTVGYGDIYPITALGRLLSSIISLIGIAMIAIPTGIISSAFMSMLLDKKKKEEKKTSSESE